MTDEEIFEGMLLYLMRVHGWEDDPKHRRVLSNWLSGKSIPLPDLANQLAEAELAISE